MSYLLPENQMLLPELLEGGYAPVRLSKLELNQEAKLKKTLAKQLEIAVYEKGVVLEKIFCGGLSVRKLAETMNHSYASVYATLIKNAKTKFQNLNIKAAYYTAAGLEVPEIDAATFTLQNLVSSRGIQSRDLLKALNDAMPPSLQTDSEQLRRCLRLNLNKPITLSDGWKLSFIFTFVITNSPVRDDERNGTPPNADLAWVFRLITEREVARAYTETKRNSSPRER